MFDKLQAQILKQMQRNVFNASPSRDDWSISQEGVDGKLTLVSPSMAVVIPERFFMLDKTKLPTSHIKLSSITKDNSGYTEISIASVTLVQLKKKRVPVCTMTDKDGTTVCHIYEDLLKMFNELPEIVLKGRDAKSPIFVYCADELFGIVMPMRRSDEGEVR